MVELLFNRGRGGDATSSFITLPKETFADYFREICSITNSVLPGIAVHGVPGRKNNNINSLAMFLNIFQLTLRQEPSAAEFP